jgi:hypothetical protein
VVVRVLDILSPINCVIPDYNFQLPEAGQLIAKRQISGRYGGYHPWSLDISSSGTVMAKLLAVLFPESSTLASPLKKCELYPLDEK